LTRPTVDLTVPIVWRSNSAASSAAVPTYRVHTGWHRTAPLLLQSVVRSHLENPSTKQLSQPRPDWLHTFAHVGRRSPNQALSPPPGTFGGRQPTRGAHLVVPCQVHPRPLSGVVLGWCCFSWSPGSAKLTRWPGCLKVPVTNLFQSFFISSILLQPEGVSPPLSLLPFSPSRSIHFLPLPTSPTSPALLQQQEGKEREIYFWASSPLFSRHSIRIRSYMHN
jgi:hypothetical protein